MTTRDDMIKKLRADKAYGDALKMAGNVEERRSIIGNSELMVSRLAAALDVMKEAVLRSSGSLDVGLATEENTR